MDAILGKWEAQSQGVKTLEASFQKWKYDIAAAPAGKVATVSNGTIRYMNPDQGHFKEERILFFNGVDAQGKDQHAEVPGRFGEWWVCTGKELVFLNRDKKEKVIESLPANMQGEQLFDSPLPFVFNLKAQRLKDRFWIRRINPPNNQQGTYWMEAWPKTQKDAQLYKLVQIVVDAKTFLPNALLIYPPNFDPQSAPNREIYEFKDVKTNHVGTNALQKLFQSQFIDPNPGENGWKEIRNHAIPNQGIPMAKQPQENGNPR
jgi:TIGR03009 family protein